MSHKITVETTIAAPIEQVWSAYVTPDDIKQWNTASETWHTVRASVDLRVGGAFSSRMEARDGSFGFDFAGTYTQIEPNKLIEFTFGERTCSVVFLSEGSDVTVRVSFDPEAENPEDMQRGGWQAILTNFKAHVEARRGQAAS